MRVRFARWLAGTVIAAGLILIVTGVVLVAGGSAEGDVPALVVGPFCALIGVGHLGPLIHVVVDGSSVSIPMTAGGQGRIEIPPGGRLRVEGDHLVVVRGGTGQRVPAYRYMAHGPDWDRMLALVRERRIG